MTTPAIDGGLGVRPPPAVSQVPPACSLRGSTQPYWPAPLNRGWLFVTLLDPSKLEPQGTALKTYRNCDRSVDRLDQIPQTHNHAQRHGAPENRHRGKQLDQDGYENTLSQTTTIPNTVWTATASSAPASGCITARTSRLKQWPVNWPLIAAVG